MACNWHTFDNANELVSGLSATISARITDALATRSQASMALSGGGTPMPLYASLGKAPLDWSRVQAVPSDERWVPGDHAANNLGQIAKWMGGSGIRLAGLVPGVPAQTVDLTAAKAALARLPEIFDVVILGMGGDGHFASLFPYSPALAAGLDPDSSESALVVTPDPLPPEAPFARISMTLSRLLATRYLVLLMTGESKRAVFRRAAHSDADARELPIAALIRAADSRLNVFWSP